MASTSPVFVENVTLGTVTHALTAKTAGNAGQAYYFTDIITPSNTNATFQPTGTVTFYDGANALSAPFRLTNVAAANGGYGLYNANLARHIAGAWNPHHHGDVQW